MTALLPPAGCLVPRHLCPSHADQVGTLKLHSIELKTAMRDATEIQCGKRGVADSGRQERRAKKGKEP
jgi:hypothetical protein